MMFAHIGIFSSFYEHVRLDLGCSSLLSMLLYIHTTYSLMIIFLIASYYSTCM